MIWVKIKGKVSTHSRPKAAGFACYFGHKSYVSTHSRPKAAGKKWRRGKSISIGFNTQPPEGGWCRQPSEGEIMSFVSTHSRPKAAGCLRWFNLENISCFNTQPPEGGWRLLIKLHNSCSAFQHTAARRRLESRHEDRGRVLGVSTHSRPKAAGRQLIWYERPRDVSTHSRPKAAGMGPILCGSFRGRFNTQPPEGGWGPHFELA